MADRPQNFFQVLAEAGSAGLGSAAQNFRGDQQQEKDNQLQMLMAGMQAAEHEQNIERGRQAQLLGAVQLKKANLNLVNAQNEVNDYRTPEQKQQAQLAAQEQEFTNQLSQLSMLAPPDPATPFEFGQGGLPAGGLGAFQLPAGSSANIGPLKLTGPPRVDPISAFDAARIKKLEAETKSVVSGKGSDKTLSASDQIVWNVFNRESATPIEADEKFAKVKTTSRMDTPEGAATTFVMQQLASPFTRYNIKTDAGLAQLRKDTERFFGVDLGELFPSGVFSDKTTPISDDPLTDDEKGEVEELKDFFIQNPGGS